MSILRDVQRLVSLTEQLAPKVKKSALWRTAAKKALREAVLLETEWREGDSLVPGSTTEPDLEEPPVEPAATGESLDKMLTEILGRPPRTRR